MILSDREIMAAIARGSIFIKDCPPVDSPRWSSTAVDLTLDAEIRPWKEMDSVGEDNTIDPMKDGFDSNALAERYTRPFDCSKGYILRKWEFVLGWTIERIKLPRTSRIAARVEGKSSLARIGLGVHVTAPTIHAGFGYNELKPKYEGSPIRLEIWNVGPLEIKLTKHMPICQLIFEEVHGTPDQGYSGQHNIQGPLIRKVGRTKKRRG